MQQEGEDRMKRFKIALPGVVVLIALCGCRLPAPQNRSKVDLSSPEATVIASAEAATLLQEFKEAEYFWQQGAVGRQLVALEDSSVVPAMLEMLKSEDRKTRCNAGRVLAGLGDDRGLFAVISELNDIGYRPINKDEARGNESKLLLFKHKPAYAHQVRSDRYYAAHMLREIGDQRAVPALIETLGDDSINYQAAIVLGHLGDKRAIPHLREMGNDVPWQRLWAGYGLAGLGEPEGFDMLEEVVNSDSQQWTHRRHAVRALGEFGNRKAVPTLVRALKDEHVNIRVSAARALGAIGDPAALDALVESLNDTEVTKINAPTTVRKEARKAIEAIKADGM